MLKQLQLNSSMILFKNMIDNVSKQSTQNRCDKYKVYWQKKNDIGIY